MLEQDSAVRAAPGAQQQRAAEPPREQWFKRDLSPFAAIRELWVFRELMVTLAERDLRVRYKQAILGIAWAVFLPVLLMLVFSVVFSRFARVNTHDVPYPLFAYIGLLPWTFFSSSVSDGGTSLITNTPLLNKVYCPREVFPLGSAVVAAVDALIASLVLGLLFAVYQFTPHWGVAFVPLLLAILIAFTVGLTLLISVVVVYMRDLRVMLPLLLQVAIFATPVAYNAGVVAHSRKGLIIYSALNPLVPVIDGLRRGILEGKSPIWISVAAGGCSATIVLLVGFWLFKRLETGIADVA